MKRQTALRDNLYQTLNDLIRYCKSFNRDLPSITLNPPEYQIFKEFNTPSVDGNYLYRNILVKCKEVKK